MLGVALVLVTTHVRPDGDALGTAAAMVLGMRKARIAAEVLLLSHLPRKYAFVFNDNEIAHRRCGERVGRPSLRFGSVRRAAGRRHRDVVAVSGVAGAHRELEGPKLVVDHHLTQEDWADVKLVVTEAAAAGEIAAELLDAWEVPLDAPIATACSSRSPATPAGSSSPTPARTRCASRRTLMEAGVDTDRIYQALYQNERAERVALHTRASSRWSCCRTAGWR